MATPKTPLLTVDCVIFDAEGRVLLIRRRNPPFQGGYALPGGFVEVGETVEAACRREVQEETGVRVGRFRLTGVYSDPKRDPRGHTCSVVFLARTWRGTPKAADDAAAVEWVANWRKTPLAFDHRRIIADAARLVADKAATPRSGSG
jgi:8-oxo-dGTP diphosphatase